MTAQGSLAITNQMKYQLDSDKIKGRNGGGQLGIGQERQISTQEITGDDRGKAFSIELRSTGDNNKHPEGSDK